MSRKAITVVIAIILAFAVGATAYIFIAKPFNPSDDIAADNIISNADEADSPIDDDASNIDSSRISSRNETSTTTTTIPYSMGSADEARDDGQPPAHSENRTASNSGYSPVTMKSHRQMDVLDTIGREALSEKARNLLVLLRNFDQAKLSDGDGWKLSISPLTDTSLMLSNTDGNILAQELDDRWRQYAVYPEWAASTLYVNVLNTYMDTIDGNDYPAASVETEEYVNADYPYPGSNHWKPLNHVKRTYLVHFNSDGSGIWKVKNMSENVIEENINNVDLGPGRNPHDIEP